MVIPILILANIPVYLFLGWLAFDSKANAATTFGDTIVAVLKTIFVPHIVRVMLNMDTEGSWGLFPICGFLFACFGVVYGEYWLLGHWWNIQ